MNIKSSFKSESYVILNAVSRNVLGVMYCNFRSSLAKALLRNSRGLVYSKILQ